MTVTDENGESKQVDANNFFEKKKQRGRPVHSTELKKIKMGLYVLPHQKKKFEDLALEFGFNASQLMAYLIDELSIDKLKKNFYLDPADRETKEAVCNKVHDNRFKAEQMSRHHIELNQEIQTSKGIFKFVDIVELYAYLEYCCNRSYKTSYLENTPLKNTLFWKNNKDKEKKYVLHSLNLFEGLLNEVGFRKKERERLQRIADRCQEKVALICRIGISEIWKVKDFHCEYAYQMEVDTDAEVMKFPENNKLAVLLIYKQNEEE